MGLWEYVQWAYDELRQRSPGADSFKAGSLHKPYGHVASATSTIVAAAASSCEKARDAVQSASKPVKDAGRHAWDCASRATGEADRVVRVEAPRWVAEQMPEAEKRQQLLVVLKEVGIGVADVAISEGVRWIPGGLPLYRVIKKGAAGIAKIQGEGVSRPSEEARHPAGGATAQAERPEEVIGWFLRDGFKGGDFLDDLIVPIPTRKESKKAVEKAD